MNIQANYERIDQTIFMFQQVNSFIQSSLTTLGQKISAFQQGGFGVRNGNNYIALMRRKMTLMQELMHTYSNAIEVLQKAKREMQETEAKLKAGAGKI